MPVVSNVPSEVREELSNWISPETRIIQEWVDSSRETYFFVCLEEDKHGVRNGFDMVHCIRIFRLGGKWVTSGDDRDWETKK